MLLTLWCIGAVLGGTLLVGVPIAWLLNRRKPLTEWAWVQAPFLAIAAVTLVLQNLVYLDVPVKIGTPFVWAGVALLWGLFWRSGQIRVSLARFPKMLFAALVFVYLVQGIGLLKVGARHYVGRGSGDELNYVVLAQFLAEEPHTLSLQQVADHPGYIHLLGSGLQWGRLGQSVLHAFFAVSIHKPSKALFEPICLLSSALIVLAVYALCRRFGVGGRLAAAAGAIGGLLPAVTLIHQDGFFSQALATPLLLYLPAALHAFSERPSWRGLGTQAVLFAGASSIYTEYWSIYLAVTVLILGVSAVRHPRARFLLAGIVVLGLSLALLNPGSLPSWVKIHGYLQEDRGSVNYPWAFQVEGLCRLWFGDLAVAWAGRKLWLVRMAGLGATLLGFCGLFAAFWRHAGGDRTEWRRNRHWTSLGFAAGALALATLPALILTRDESHSYQFYKVLQSVSPLLVVGLALLCQPPRPGVAAAPVPPNGVARLPFRAFAVLTLGGTFAMAVMGTGEIAYQTAKNTFTSGHCPGFYLLAPETRQAMNRLEKLRGKNLLITSPEGEKAWDGAGWATGWLAHAACRNRVWVTHPMYNHISLVRVRKDAGFPEVPAEAVTQPMLVLTSYDKLLLPRWSAVGAKQLWSNAGYDLWEVGPGPWAVPLTLTGHSLQKFQGKLLLWIDKDGASVDVWANRAGDLTVGVSLKPGPNLPPAARGAFRVETSGGYSCQVVVRPEADAFTVPVKPGRNTVKLIPLDPPNGAPLPGWTAQVLWGVIELKLQLAAPNVVSARSR